MNRKTGKAEKDVRDFYQTHSPQELQAEIAREDNSLRHTESRAQ